VAALSNAHLAELLANSAEEAEGMRQKALRRAARSAFLWPEECADLLAAGRSLTELHTVGPFVAEKLRGWIEAPPALDAERDPLRHDFLTMAQAKAILARDLNWAARLRGDLHMHTTWSDGSGTVREMGEAGIAAGHAYVSITDHAKGLKIAGGIDEAQIAEQAQEIAAANEQLAGKITVLQSIELNLNPRGEGDMEPTCLAELDLVLASFHSALRKTEDQTERYLAALRNPTIQILGHPRGRVYNFRIGLSADWPRVFAEAARLDKAVEVDCYPDRQDLNVELLKLAGAAGTRVSLGTDAHHASQLGFIELGLAATLEAGIAPDRIVNFLSLPELKEWVANVRAAA
jgi:DNA polymerase (family 10)